MRTFQWLKRLTRLFRPGSYALMTAALVTVLLANAPARAVFIINPTFDSTITGDPQAATIEGTINAAISVYEAKFSDPITVNINFGEGGGLGQSSTFFANVSYATYLAALTADAKTSNDAVALAHLPLSSTNPVNGSSTINVKTANLRAVGINTTPPPGQPDGSILLKTSIMNLSRSGPQDPSKYDLMAVASHEIDEVLGLGSSLPSAPFGTIFPEDLFRYDASGNRSFTTSNSAQAYFSIDGTTDLAQFHNTNDGADYGDWESNGTPRVQDAFGTPGAQPNLGVELTALDVIGYDLNPPVAAAPEPASVTLLGICGACLALSTRLRRRAVA
jgi:hypothetical protein